MNNKKILIRFVTILVFTACTLFALFVVVQMSNESWMRTIDALGGGGWGSFSAVQERWILLLIAAITASASAFIFMKTYRGEASK